ncbi:desmocollin-2-like [Candoia aspera]|uniref:desmocollin-2-like n=1 Tax=Candoia aspera TaxID=51853 RepID=UPI002FD7AB46
MNPSTPGLGTETGVKDFLEAQESGHHLYLGGDAVPIEKLCYIGPTGCQCFIKGLCVNVTSGQRQLEIGRLSDNQALCQERHYRRIKKKDCRIGESILEKDRENAIKKTKVMVKTKKDKEKLRLQPLIHDEPVTGTPGQMTGSEHGKAKSQVEVNSELLFGSEDRDTLDLFCEACNEVSFNVPHKLEMGMFIGRVNVKHCLNDTGIIGISNPNFIMLEDGSLYTKNAISLTSHESIITVFFKSIHEDEQRRIYVSLLTYPQKTSKTKKRHVRATVLGRTKRRWAPVPTTIMENLLGPFPVQIQQLSSDMAQKYNIRYFITGPGVDKPPLNYFYIEQETGNLFVTCPIDREEYPEFQLICYAMTPDGYTPEVPLVHNIKIEDDNDNAPEFEYNIYTFHVLENSRVGTLVGQVTATDEDEPNTLHSKVKYRIISQNHQKLQEFVIDPDSGCITVALHLDRETVSAYTLRIEARDMGGEEFGLWTSAAVHIEIRDVNDNLPQIAQTMYVVEVYENTEHAEILCIPVEDKDEPRTSSWMGTFTITKGNEDNSFSFTVDGEQNIGCLSALKGLDYEKSHERRLEIVINNEAPYVPPPNSRALPTSMASVVVRIKDQDEGPVFESCEYILYIKEPLLVGTVVGNYQANDPETGNNGNLSYRIINDPCRWIAIDQMGNLRTTDILERDSQNIEYGQCNATVSATDQSGKTGTGTVVITLIIENNYPVSTSKLYVMCKDKKPIWIKAADIDLPSSVTPFHFEIEKPMDLKWKLTPNDDASALLSSVEDIDYGYYYIPLRIYNGGNSRKSEIIVRYCDCAMPSNCSESSTNTSLGYSSSNIQAERSPAAASFLGAWSIPAMVMGSLVMLLGFGTPYGLWLHRKFRMPQEASDDLTFQNLTKSDTEAPAEDHTNLSIFPLTTVKECIKMSPDEGKTEKQEDLEAGKGGGHSTSELVKGGKVYHVAQSLQDCKHSLRTSKREFCSEWQNFTNPHLSERVFRCGEDEEHNLVKEYLLPYNYEGKDSPTGSLSSCTGESEEEELSFLNHPEPPFRTLAEAFVKK